MIQRNAGEESNETEIVMILMDDINVIFPTSCAAGYLKHWRNSGLVRRLNHYKIK